MAVIDIDFPGNLGQVDTIADLRGVPSYFLTDDLIYAVLDGGFYRWDPSSLAVDDGSTVVKPNDRTALQAGRWLISDSLSDVKLRSDLASDAPGKGVELVARGGFNVETLDDIATTTIPGSTSFFRALGKSANGDGGAVSLREISNPGTLGPGQFPSIGSRFWEIADNIVTPAMFGGNIEEMLTFTRAQMQIPAGNYEFDAAIAVRNNAIIQMEPGATLIPTFEPTGGARATPLINLGTGCNVNYIKLQLDAGINTIRKGIQVGDYSQIGYIECVSSDLNNNRTQPGSTDLISAAVLIDGDHIRIGQIYLNRFDAGWAVIDSTDVQIGHIRNLETVTGGYVHGTRDLHVFSGYTTGPTNPAEPNGFVNPRGIMTPGANSLLLGGCSDSSFSNWFSFDTLEHAIRVGQMASGTSVPNRNLQFSGLRLIRPYGCGFKCDDADDFAIKYLNVSDLYTEDVGHNNWFGDAGFQNWASGGVNNPAANNDGNKIACAIRNSQFVTLTGFMNRKNAYAASGHYGLWLERSNNVQGSNIDTEYSRSHGVVVQSGGPISPERISMRGVRTHYNTGDGLVFDATSSGATWRGVSATDVDSQLNTGYGFTATGRQADNLSPYATIASRVEGCFTKNTAGQKNINANVAADTADFIDNIIP